ncbi:XrtA system polysaccharide deacetylase [Futiania mangrovi]|uniref:Chitooligosaccharide deacetylase n=1 Tax=Futiania mangrovi TaxID=2959716 RepID=A0A9J6PII8_9PROT|nr:XrtA system polysaccharide deacetylase [Futiania mangrovii]MCP1335898.1 DUF3473 domain-containing protein [Futiania mangrovii]
MSASPKPGVPLSAMTVDVEDYYQVSAFEGVVDPADWDSLPSRVETNTERLLDFFGDHDVRITFFTLGMIAQRFPRLIARMAAEGHEIASHGWSHVRIFHQDRAAFAEDVRKTKATLEDAAGVEVRGYRAASFSLTKATPWAYEVLAEAGYAYSSSVNPISHDLYDNAHLPRTPFREPTANMLEIPVTTALVKGRRKACGGGGFFRILPYGMFTRRLRSVVQDENIPAVFYFHPWEIDPDQPRIAGAPLKSRIRHYTNLSRMEGKLDRLMREFRWGRMDAAFQTDASALLAAE